MPISLSKGGSARLTAPPGTQSLDHVQIGLGWDEAPGDRSFDVDASVVLLDGSGRVRSDDDLVFYGNLRHESGAVVHGGDSTDGAGGGDDESIAVTLGLLSPSVQRVTVLVSIHDAADSGQHFGLVSNAYIRVVDTDRSVELARFDLSVGADGEDCLAFGELYREADGWAFAALGDYHDGGLTGALRSYGIDVG